MTRRCWLGGAAAATGAAVAGGSRGPEGTARGARVEVQVRLFANLAEYGPPSTRGGAGRVELPEGATVADLLARLGVPDEGPRLLLVNGRDAEAGVTLHAGDVVDVLPPLVGG